MMKRVEQQQVDAMIEDSKESVPEAAGAAPADGPEALAKEPLTAEFCTYDDFVKVDMRVARVVEAEEVKESDKLLRLTLSLGGDVRRNVFAGIKGVYKPEDSARKIRDLLCQPRPAKNAVRSERRHGAGGRRRRQGDLRPASGRGSRTRATRAIEAANVDRRARCGQTSSDSYSRGIVGSSSHRS